MRASRRWPRSSRGTTAKRSRERPANKAPRPGRPAGDNPPSRPRPPPSSAPFRQGTVSSRAVVLMVNPPVRFITPAWTVAPGPANLGVASPDTSEQSRSDPLPSRFHRRRSGRQRQPVWTPRARFRERGVAPLAIGVDDCRSPRREPCQSGNGRPRLLAHHVVERAADQQEEQQRCGSVEIGVRSVMKRVVEAQAESNVTPIEIGTSMFVRQAAAPTMPTQKKSCPSRGQPERKCGRDPVKCLARATIGAPTRPKPTGA